jgi:hypothetical protein
MIFTVIGYDTEAFEQIYEIVDAKTAEEAVLEVRETWDSEQDIILAVFKGEPNNLYDEDDDPVAQKANLDDGEDMLEDEEDEENDFGDDDE